MAVVAVAPRSDARPNAFLGRTAMRTFQRAAAVLVYPAIMCLGVACERTDTPTGAAPRPLATVGGPTCNVPVDYLTIQAAVNDPGCSTIVVAPGAYAENVSIPRTLTLNGAQAANPVAGRVSGGPLESTVTGDWIACLSAVERKSSGNRY